MRSCELCTILVEALVNQLGILINHAQSLYIRHLPTNLMMQADLSISNQAVDRINQLLASKDNPDLMLRVYIQGGGCSGFQYGFQFDENEQEDDIAIEQSGIKVVVDMLSLQYLGGAEIDFKDDIMGSRFLVNNPNASATCGCGSSFAI